MRKPILYLLILVVIGTLGYMGYFYYKNLRGALPAIKEPTADISDLVLNDKTPLVLPEGFQLSIYANSLPGARALAMDPNGNLVVSLLGEGKVVLLLDKNFDGRAGETKILLKDLKNPHGLAFDCVEVGVCKLYVAQEDKVMVYDYDIQNLVVKNERKILDLPDGGRHTTRSLLLKDKTLYVAVGSSCNVCHESDAQRASILAADLTTNKVVTFAKGLRNSVFMAIRPSDNKIWATDMGRDFIGDDIPPDEINIVEEGKNYGWPNCFGKNIHDDDFDKNTYIRNPCMTPFETPSHIDIQAHSAPLGLAFVPKDVWSAEYGDDLLVAYHGSFNRTVPTGYKIVRYHLDENGEVLSSEDFLTGFLQSDGSLYGRPVDILIDKNGIMFVSDDKSGVIYRISVKK